MESRGSGPEITPVGSAAFHVVDTPAGEGGYPDGAVSPSGAVWGTYMHGLFHNANLRTALFNFLRQRRGLPEAGGETPVDRDEEYDKLAALVRKHMDIDSVYRILEEGMDG